MTNIIEMVAKLTNQSPNDFILRETKNYLKVYIKTRASGALHIMNARPSGGGFNIEITAPNAFYFGADGRLYLSSWAEDY